MNKQTMFVQRREAGITTSEQVDYYLAADVEAHLAEVVRELRAGYLKDAARIAELERENDQLRSTNLLLQARDDYVTACLV